MNLNVNNKNNNNNNNHIPLHGVYLSGARKSTAVKVF